MTTTQTPSDNFIPADAQVIKQQIGMWNVLATSGGRVIIRETGITLPCNTGGYQVTVDLAAGDTYTVRRVISRRRRGELLPTVTIRGEREGVYCEQLGEVVYRAGCFRDEWV